MKLSLVTIVISVSLTASAQIRFSSLEDVWRYAREYNSDIRGADVSLSVAREHIRKAQGTLLPEINTAATFTNNIQIQPTLVPAELFGGKPGTFTEQTFGKRYIYNANITAHLDLINISSWQGIKVSRASLLATDANRKHVEEEILIASAEAFFDCILAQEAMRFANENVATATLMRQSFEELFVNGIVSEDVVNDARISQEKSKLSRVQAQGSAMDAMLKFRVLLNLSAQDTIELPRATDAALIQRLQTDALKPEHLSSVRVAQAQAEQANLNVRHLRSAYLPVLSTFYTAGLQTASDQLSTFEGANSLPQQYWGVRLTIPLITNASRKTNVGIAEINLSHSRRNYEDAITQAALRIRHLNESYNQAYEAVLHSSNILTLYRENYIHEERKFAEGISNERERLQAYHDLVTHQDYHLKMLANFMSIHAQIKVLQRHQ